MVEQSAGENMNLWKDDPKMNPMTRTQELITELIKQNKVWYNWHCALYSQKTALTYEAMYQDELSVGLNFKAALTPPKK